MNKIITKMSKVTTLKSLEKIMYELKAQMIEMKSDMSDMKSELKADMSELKSELKADMKADLEKMKAGLEKGQKDIVDEMRELREEITRTKKQVVVLEESVKFLHDDCEMLKKESARIMKDVENVKLDNERFTKKMVDLDENGKQVSIKLNQIENWMKGNNIEIQGVPASENENVEIIAMKVLKKVDPRIERHQLGLIRRLRAIDTKTNQEDKKEGKKIHNPILVIFKSREQKIKTMKEKKNLYNADLTDINAERVYLNENLTKISRNLLFLARRFKKEKGWKYAWSSSGTVLLRKDEKSKVNVINSVEDIEKLQN